MVSNNTHMITKNTIGTDGCACGDYESDGLIASASCRKSGSSPSWDNYIAHLLRYRLKKDDGIHELGDLIDHMLYFGGDGVVVERDEELTIDWDGKEELLAI